MKKLLLFALVLAAGQQTLAQTTTFTPVSLTGFTADVIANGSGTVASSTSTDVDGASFALTSSNYVNPSNASPTTGLPATGAITGIGTPAINYQLEAYTGNNSLRIATPGSGTLTFATPRAADQLYILATSGSGISIMNVTVNFTDATTQVLSAQSVADWYGGTNYAIRGISRVSTSTNQIENPLNDPRLYQIPMTIQGTNTGKLIQSITFNKTSTTGVLNVFAVTARFTTPAMANDLGITGVAGLGTGCALSNQETIRVTITNTGTASQTNFPVSYKINNLAPVTETFTGTVAAFGTATHTFATKADLSNVGSYRIQGKALLTTDGNASNDTTSIKATNSLLPALPVSLDFETAPAGLSVFQKTLNTNSGITEGPVSLAGPGAKAMIMDGRTASNWVIPAGTLDPWNTNPAYKAEAKICINPAGGNSSDPLWLSFDLKQLFKFANANTNFRVTVNGTQVGPTYRPPFSGTPIVWQRINVNLSSFKNLPSIEVGFESSVKEEFAGGSGTANLVDNIVVTRSAPTGLKNYLDESLLSVFPNPSKGIFTLDTTHPDFAMEVTDLTGKVLLKKNVKGQHHQVDLNHFAKGIYLLKVVSKGKTATRKLVIE